MTLSDQGVGVNSFYILQVIQEDGARGEGGCYLFRAWGRVGDSRIGDRMIEPLKRRECVQKFEDLFYKKCGNTWAAWTGGEEMRKHAGKLFPLEMDYGKDRKANAAKMEETMEREAHEAVTQV
jgi:poly [ADP-ribose] polymerase